MGILVDQAQLATTRDIMYEGVYRDVSAKLVKRESSSSDGDLALGAVESTAARILAGPGCFDCVDDLLLFSFFRDALTFNDKGYEYGSREHIGIKVQATILCRGDSLEPLGDKKKQREIGSNMSFFVGEVSTAPEMSRWKPGELVTSLRKCAVGSKFVKCSPETLVPIPSKVDPGEAATVVSTYAPAMGMLHHGHQPDHHSKGSLISTLKGLNVLVTGGGSGEADALTKLAILCGARKVTVLVSGDMAASHHEWSWQVEHVGDEPSEFLPRLDGLMDLIVDLEYPKNFGTLYGALKATGRHICGKPIRSERSVLDPLHDMMMELSLVHYPNASMYDMNEQIDDEYGDFVWNLRFLFQLLESRKIRPKIDKYIKTTDISVVVDDMQRNPGSGAVVCEPWR